MTVTLYPTADNRIGHDDGVVAANLGASWLTVGETNEATNTPRRVLIQFDLSGIPAGSLINSATLRLYQTHEFATNARTMSVYRLLVSWDEMTSTWARRSTGVNWTSNGAFNAADCEQTGIGSRSFSATETVNAWKEFTLDTAAISEIVDGTFTNNGFHIRMATELNDAHRFYSREAGNSPELVIDYTSPNAISFQAVIIGD